MLFGSEWWLPNMAAARGGGIGVQRKLKIPMG